MAHGININREGNTFNIDLGEKYKLKWKEAQARIEELQAEIDRLETEAFDAQVEISNLNDRVSELSDHGRIGILEKQIDSLKQHTSMAREEFAAFLRTVGLMGSDGIPVDKGISAWMKDVSSGAITANEAMTKVKASYAPLIEANNQNGGSLFDAQSLQTFIAKLESISTLITDVSGKIAELYASGGAMPGGGEGSGAVMGINRSSATVLEDVRAAMEGMSAEAQAAYQPIIQLMQAIIEYGNLDTHKLLAISNAFSSIASIGSGSFTVKSVRNLTDLMTVLKKMSDGGYNSVKFDYSGLSELTNLKVSKASLSNLAEYLPTIAKVNTSNLKALTNLDFTNLNNIKVSKASIQSIAQLAESLNMIKDMPGLIENIGGGKSGGEGSADGKVSNVKLLGQIADLHSGATKLQTLYPNLDMSGFIGEIDKLKAVVGEAGDISIEDLKVCTGLYNELNTQLKEYRDGVSTTTLEIEKMGDVTKSQTINQGEFANKADKLVSTVDQIEKIEGKLQGSYSITNSAEQLRTQALALGEDIRSASASDEQALLNLRQRYVELIGLIQQYQREISSAARTDPSAVNNINTGSMRVTLESLTDRALKLDNNEEFISRIERAKQRVAELASQVTKFKETGEGDLGHLTGSARALDDELKAINADLRIAARTDPSAGNAEAQSATQNLNFLRQVQSSAKSARELLSNNTKLYGTDLGRSLQGLIGDYDNFITKVKESPPQTKAAFNEYQSEFAALKERLASLGLEMEKTGVQGNTLFTRFANGIKKFGGWTIVTRALTSVIRLGKQMVTNVKEIDSAMTQLRIVTNASGTEMEKYGDKIAASAKKIGASITDLTDSATTYARLGYSLEESTSLAEYTSMLKAVGDIDVSDAQDAITAITKAFDIDASQIEGVMDKLVTVGKHSCPTAWQHAA